MIVNPIIPIWLMGIICVILIVLILYNKSLKKKLETKNKKVILNFITKIMIVILLFVINLRIMIPNGETTAINADLKVLFVVDTSVSMKALDYNGNNERISGAMEDCCYIIDELGGCKYSIIKFGNDVKKIIPFTTDSDMVQAELKSIMVENDVYAKGSSLNLIKDYLEDELKAEKDKKDSVSKFVVFFVSDGEITKDGERLESFSSLSKYVSGGAVLGYGTESGGKMVSTSYEDKPDSDYYYISVYNEEYKREPALSKIDENNLKKIASDMKIDYVRMNKQSNIDGKLKEIKRKISETKTTEEKISSYQDIYYIFAIPLVILLMVNFVIQKMRI